MLQKYDCGASKHVYDIVTPDESCIYGYEPKSKQQPTVWLFQHDWNPTKVARLWSTSKQVIACFFGKTGHVAFVPLEQSRTVSSEWYTTICLPVVSQRIWKINCLRRIDLMGHPPYSPDLAPNDFFLFSYVKNAMRGQRFSTPEEAVDAFRMHILEIRVPQSEWQKCFDNWFKRLQKCMDLNGEYFEKQ